MPQGIKLDDLDNVNRPATHNPAFIKKNNIATKIFIVVAIVVGIAIIALLVWVILFSAKKTARYSCSHRAASIAA